jgi:hypothetical protein
MYFQTPFEEQVEERVSLYMEMEREVEKNPPLINMQILAF